MTAFTVEIAVVMAVTCMAIALFISERLRVDVVALLVLVALGLAAYVPGVEPLLSTHEVFAGFSSNAVISIIAVMIIGAGLYRS